MAKLKQLLGKWLPAGGFARNVVTLITGTTFAQALVVLVTPILTRLYSPDDFGVFALYTSILSIMAVVACWRYELAIVLPEEEKDAANLLILSICICFSMAFVTLVLVVLFRNPIAMLLSAPRLAPWLLFMPLSIVAVGFFQAFNYWSARRKKFKRIAIRTVTQSIITVTAQLGSGIVLHPGPGGLIGSSIIGQLTATIRMAWHIWRDDSKVLYDISLKGIKKQAVLYKEFPLYQIWAAVLNVISSMTPLLLLGYFFSPAIVGFYVLGQRLVATPLGIVGSSVSQVFFPRAELAHRQGTLDELVVSTFQKLLTIGLFPILVLSLIGPELIGLIFGSDWVVAGVFLRLLSPYLLFNFLSASLSPVFSVLGKQKEYLLFNITYFLLAVSAFIIGGYKHDAELAVTLFGTIAFLLYCYFGAKIFQISGVTLSAIWLAVSTVLVPIIRFFIPILFVVMLPIKEYVSIILSLILTLAYFIYILRREKNK